MAFGERLKRARIGVGMTQGQLADALRTTSNSVSNWEKGVSKPYADMLAELCQILNVDANWLLGWVSDALTYDGQRIGHLYDKAEPPHKQAVELILKPYDDGKPIKITPPTKQDAEIADELDPDAKYPELKLYTQSVAAGLGNYQDDDDYELVRFKDAPRRADIAVKVSGDSMEPDYNNGDIVFVETDSVLSDGEIGIFNYDGEGYIKELRLDPARLVSLNPKYEDKFINTDGDIPFKTIGRVVGIAE